MIGSVDRRPTRARRGGAPARGALAVVGLALGGLTALLELVALVPAALVLAVAAFPGRGNVPPLVGRAALALAGLERRRLAVCFGYRRPAEYGPRAALAYLALRVPIGLLGLGILALTAWGATAGLALLASWWITGDYMDGIPPEPWLVAYTAGMGAVLLFVAVQGMIGVVALERAVARRHLEPSPLAAYERRIAELAESRADVVRAVDDERRRIERDLHDGIQQRLVALGMLIGRARRAGDGERAGELLRQAHEESRHALEDLRETAWRIYPAALDGDGLRAALDTVAERSPLPVTIDAGPSGRAPHAVETAAYFVVCEAVTNAAKHAGATRVAVAVTETVREGGTMMDVRIEDDGAGGADPAGGGLAGLARRVAALDGAFEVDSPPGGPTVVRAELPCG